MTKNNRNRGCFVLFSGESRAFFNAHCSAVEPSGWRFTFDASILGPEFGGEADYSQEEEEKSFSTEPDPDEPFPFATLNKWLSYILDKESELTSEEEDIVSLCTEITEKYAY